MSRRYRVNRFRYLKKYLDMYTPNLGVSVGETKRESVLRMFEKWHRKRYLNRYVDKYIKDSDVKSKTGSEKVK